MIEINIDNMPNSKETEQRVIGALITDNEAIQKVIEILKPGDFYKWEHAELYKTICKNYYESKNFDAITIAEDTIKRNKIVNPDELIEYCESLENGFYPSVNILKYATILRDKSTKRTLLNIAQNLAELCTGTGTAESESILNYAENAIFKIREDAENAKSKLKHIKDHAVDALEDISQTIERLETETENSTGFSDLDELIKAKEGHLVLIAGRPAMGKTTLALNIAKNMSEQKKKILILSLEMTGKELTKKMFSIFGKVNNKAIENGTLTDHEWEQVTYSISKIHDTEIYIEELSYLTPQLLKSKAKKANSIMQNIDLIVIDYLQLMTVENEQQNKTAEVSEVSRALKLLAKELNCPIIALSQLNRSLEQRPNKRPIMSDLRDSGSLEQDADSILFVYRDEIYDKETPEKGIAEIIVAKNRHGQTGSCKLKFIGEYSTFENLS